MIIFERKNFNMSFLDGFRNRTWFTKRSRGIFRRLESPFLDFIKSAYFEHKEFFDSTKKNLEFCIFLKLEKVY